MLELLYPLGPAPVRPSLNSEMVEEKDSASKEFLPVVDENGIVLAQADREYVHGTGHCMHPVVHLHIIDREGRIYLQKRAATKSILPGYWDTAVGGHVGYGESITEALFREAGEELGLHNFNPVFIDSYVFETKVDLELVSSFAAVGNFEPSPDADEVECGRYWTFKEIENALGKSVLTSNFELEFQKYKNALWALL